MIYTKCRSIDSRTAETTRADLTINANVGVTSAPLFNVYSNMIDFFLLLSIPLSICLFFFCCLLSVVSIVAWLWANDSISIFMSITNKYSLFLFGSHFALETDIVAC